MKPIRRPTDELSDLELLLMARDEPVGSCRREAAAEFLVNRYHAKLIAYADRLLSGTTAYAGAEDIVNQVELELFTSRSVNPNVVAGLYARTRHRVIDALRRTPEQADDPLDVGAGTEPGAAHVVGARDDAYTVAVRNERFAGLIGAIDRLPPASREAIVNQHFLGMTRAEAARALRVTEDTERTQRHRALTELRALVAAEDPDY